MMRQLPSVSVSISQIIGYYSVLWFLLVKSKSIFKIASKDPDANLIVYYGDHLKSNLFFGFNHFNEIT